jgi:hypothetical protein
LSISPASGLLVDSSTNITLCGFPSNLPWIIFSIQQPMDPSDSLYMIDRVSCVFPQQFNSILAEVSKYLPKRPLSLTLLMAKHYRNNPLMPTRPLLSHLTLGMAMQQYTTNTTKDSITYIFWLSAR